MSTMDVVQVIGVISTIIISIIALFQSSKSKQIADLANGLSKEANVLSLKAIWDTQKDYMPVIRLVDKFEIKEKNIFELSNEITFDFFNTISNKLGYLDCDKFKCISVTIENVGKGIITGISIDKLRIEFGNEDFIKHDEELGVWTEPLCDLSTKASKRFILTPSEKIEINLIISNDEEEDAVDLEGKVLEYEENNERKIEEQDILVSMSFYIGSLNDNEEEYYEEELIGLYGNGKIKYSSFDRLSKVGK